MSRTKRTSKRQRKFAATCRVLHSLRHTDNDDARDLDHWMVASGGPVQ